MDNISLSAAVESLAGALLIGLLIGGQREAAHRSAGHTDLHLGIPPGLRDYLIVALAAGVCGLLGIPRLTAPVLVSMTAFFALLHYEQRADRRGITTEPAAVSTFALSYLAASPTRYYAEPVAIG